MRDKILKRIQCLPKDILQESVNKLKKYNVKFYNRDGSFDYDMFRERCRETAEILFQNDKPHTETEIRYQLCDFLSVVETIVGLRNFGDFMSDLD